MFYNNELRDGMQYGDLDINITNQNANMNTNTMDVNYGGGMPGGCCQNQMMETPQERVVHRTFLHEVPHVCPINTKIVNHHIYRHTYQPRYTCCEENVVQNEQCGSCCQFK